MRTVNICKQACDGGFEHVGQLKDAWAAIKADKTTFPKAGAKAIAAKAKPNPAPVAKKAGAKAAAPAKAPPKANPKLFSAASADYSHSLRNPSALKSNFFRRNPCGRSAIFGAWSYIYIYL